MIIAVSVILIISILSVAALSRTLAGLRASRQSQDFQAALGNADSGVSDALFRLDQTGIASIDGMCPTSDLPPCNVTSVPGAPDTTYTLEKIDANTARIRSKGITNGQPHAVEAIAYRSILFPFAVFGDGTLEFSGDPEDITSSPDTTAVTAIGTNGIITCDPSNPADSSFVFPPSASSDCDAEVGSGIYDPKEPTTSCPAPENTPTTPCLPPAGSYLDCPTVTPASNILMPTITAGVYRCNKGVVFPLEVRISGLVELFIFPAGTEAPFVLGNTTVNYDTLAAVTPGVPGDARNFRLYAAGGGAEVTDGASDRFRFSGVLWAPGVTLRGNGCQSDYNGAIVVKDFDCNGGPNLSINYDTRLSSIVDTNWLIRDFTEIPSSKVIPL